jgi:hypothetical protein
MLVIENSLTNEGCIKGIGYEVTDENKHTRLIKTHLTP